MKRRKIGTVVRPDENVFTTTQLTRVATPTTVTAASLTTSANISSEENSKAKHNLKNKTFEVEKKAENEISATATPTFATPTTTSAERRRNLQKSTNSSSNRTIKIAEQQLSASVVHLKNQSVTLSHNGTHQQKVKII